MFTDMQEALEAEALELTELGSGQSTAASLVVAHHARDKDDLADLLGALGLPRSEDDLVTLLPHLTTPDTPTTGAPMPANAYTATAASMLNNGDSPEHVRDTLGLTESELADALQQAKTADAVQPTGLPAVDADTEHSTSTPEADPAAESDCTMDADQIEALLVWAENHPAAAIRNRAARVRSDLTELTDRRTADAAQRAAEQRVANAKAELEAAQAQLRQVKAGRRTATEDQTTSEGQGVTAVTAAPASNGKRSKEQPAAIRTWARANSHQVADAGVVRRSVVDAYDAAHRTTTPAEAS
ncbi:Lsr2 family DNA-binding protein [Streptomyces caniscabiei]|uniref:Lsr2 family DNA-binding protein n=2 Tax=Streptomyces caniscabiei TaxID=2746961 RepID=UPI00076610B2|nr:histone-like nucleoid-structuring protein Lsr2 [Streptomyces caniscabiei]